MSAAGAEGQNAAQACAWADGWGGPQGRGAVKSRMAPSAERGTRTWNLNVKKEQRERVHNE